MELELHIQLTHDDLVNSAYRWVLKHGSCGAAFKEFNTLACNGEFPDVIGFGCSGGSVLIECKASRSDFHADKRKSFRKNPELGMGSKRYYCCAAGLIKVEDLPEGWGLIYVDGKGKATCIHKAKVPHPNAKYAADGKTVDYVFQKNLKAEHELMYSALRRLHNKKLVEQIYETDTNN